MFHSFAVFVPIVINFYFTRRADSNHTISYRPRPVLLGLHGSFRPKVVYLKTYAFFGWSCLFSLLTVVVYVLRKLTARSPVALGPINKINRSAVIITYRSTIVVSRNKWNLYSQKLNMILELMQLLNVTGAVWFLNPLNPQLIVLS